jgi:hypothetical protein
MSELFMLMLAYSVIGTSLTLWLWRRKRRRHASRVVLFVGALVLAWLLL